MTNSDDQKHRIWQFGNIKVEFEEGLDGGGSYLGPLFVEYMRKYHADRIPFEFGFEWCAGPGFIGFALLEAGICRRLCLADINPRAVACAQRTARNNNIEDRVEIYQSDNFTALPEHLRFDLVVSNPPNYYCINPKHHMYDELKADLRPNDLDWAIHRAFYNDVHRHLKDGALLCIEEVDPFADTVYMPASHRQQPIVADQPYDLRPRPAIDDFRRMIYEGGLSYQRTRPLMADPLASIMESKYVASTMDQRRSKGGSCRIADDLVVMKPAKPVSTDTEVDLVALRIDADDQYTYHSGISIEPENHWVIELLTTLSESHGPHALNDLATRHQVSPRELHESLEFLEANRWIYFTRPASGN